MIIKVLGPGCANCVNLEKNTRAALESLGVEASDKQASHFPTILGYGGMKTPGLVIDEEVVVSGKVAKPAEIAALISARI